MKGEDKRPLPAPIARALSTVVRLFVANDRAWHDAKARVVHVALAVAVAATGVAFWLFPHDAMAVLGFAPLATNDAVVETKAFYGAMEVGLGLALLTMDTDTALYVGAAFLTSCAVGRVATATWGSIHLAIAVAEALGALTCVLAHAVESKAKATALENAEALKRRQRPSPTSLADFVPFAPENVQDPFPFYKALRTEAPVHRPQGVDYYLVSRAADVQTVAKNPDVFSSNLVEILVAGSKPGSSAIRLNMEGLTSIAGGVVDVLALQDPPIHTGQRRIALAGLTPKLFAGLEPRIRALAVAMLQRFSDTAAANGPSQGADWMDLVALRLPMTVVLEVCGFPCDEATSRRIKTLADRTVQLMSAVNTPEELFEHAAKGRELFKWIQERFAEKRAAAAATSTTTPELEHAEAAVSSNTTDFMRELVAATAKGDLQLAEAESILLQIILAGNDSTASTIGAAMKILCERPDIAATLRAKPDAIPAFVEEVLRFEPAFTGHYRKVKRDFVLSGVQLKKGDRVMLLWASANRDEAVWDRPDEFVMDRGAQGKAHFTFGHGIHACVGAPLARREIRIVVEEALKMFSSMRLAPVKPYYVDNTFIRTLARCHVVVEHDHPQLHPQPHQGE